MNKKILIADDEKEIVDLLGAALQREGMDVVVAYDGEEAKIKILNFRPDIVLLDLVMPRLDGWGVLKWLRQEMKMTTPAIIISARDQIGDVKKGYELRADYYIIKPVNPRDLIKAINLVSFIKESKGNEQN